jgi:hypothetical protein
VHVVEIEKITIMIKIEEDMGAFGTVDLYARNDRYTGFTIDQFTYTSDLVMVRDGKSQTFPFCITLDAAERGCAIRMTGMDVHVHWGIAIVPDCGQVRPPEPDPVPGIAFHRLCHPCRKVLVSLVIRICPGLYG